MPIETYWMIEGRVSYFRYQGKITVDEIAVAAQTGIQMLESSDALLVHTLQDGREITDFPKNIGQILAVSREAQAHPQMGWGISVGLLDPATRYIAGMVYKIARTRQRFISNMDDALDFLQSIDQTLPDVRKAYDAFVERESIPR